MKKTIFLLCYLLIIQFVPAQTRKITGTVKAQEDGLPLPGVTVVVTGTKGQAIVTNVEGKYSINVAQGKSLTFSYVGYKTSVKPIPESGVLNVMMESDSRILDEVVAIGYGTMKKSDLTGAVSSVKGDQLQKTPAAGLDQALQGKVSGVTVNANSGQPGAAAVVRIRGIGTTNNSSPIYVVDGMIVENINFLSPNDIESTEVLKDASATAIYGSRGANGVIIVTTKKGKSGQSNLSFNMYSGFQNRWNKLDLMKRDEFAQTIIALNNVASEKNYFNKKGFNSWLSAYRLGKSPYYPVIKSATNPEGFDYSTVETDWQDEVFKANALIQNYHLSIDGGNEKDRYAISGSYFNQDGTIIGSNYERLTLRINSSHKVRSWVTVGENLSFQHATGRNAMNNSSSPGASVLAAALAMAPWDPTHYTAGSMNLDGKDLSGQIAASSNFRNVVNPFSMVQNSEPKTVDERWVGNIYADITPFKNLTLHSAVSLDLLNNTYRLFKYSYLYSDYDKADKNYLASTMSKYSTLTFENTLTYSAKMGKSSLTAMVGQTTEEYNYHSIGGSGASILNPTEENWLLSKTTDDRTYAGESMDRTRRFSVLSRLHYSFDNKYLVTLNFRADGSSIFPEYPWGYFPSVALAWRLSDESWMKEIENIDNLKLRLGWGRIGNDRGVGSSSFSLNMFNAGPSFVDYVLGASQSLANGAAVLTYTNSGGKWETTEQMNVGLDFGLFKGFINGNVDLFRRDTKDMIMYVKAPAYVGNRYDPQSNVGKVRNSGIELNLEHQNRIGKVGYSASVNASFIHNELIALNGGSVIYGDKWICDQNYGLYTYWGYKYQGVYKSDNEALTQFNKYTANDIPFHAGDAKFADLNGNGKLDDGDITNIGNPFPWLTYGFNLGADYSGFDIQLFFQGVYGNDLYNAQRERTEGKGLESSLSTTMRNVWSASNPDGSIPNPYGSSYNTATSSRFVESGAYLRLKTLQLGYTIPQKITKKININKVRFYALANNLITFTGYTGYDPEVGEYGIDYGNYPQSRTIMFGLNVDF